MAWERREGAVIRIFIAGQTPTRNTTVSTFVSYYGDGDGDFGEDDDGREEREQLSESS